MHWNDGEDIEDFDSYAQRRLRPAHFWNCASTVISLLGFLVWLLSSPHTSSIARELDRKLGAYYALQLLANMAITLTNMYHCSTSSTLGYILWVLNFVLFYGISIISTNIMSHRYLAQKASFIAKSFEHKGNSTSILDASFKWEARSLYLVAVGVPLYLIYPIAGIMTAVLGGVVTIVMDTTFSFVLTRLFLRPILKILGEGHRLRNTKSEAFKNIQKTKYLTLAGAALSVSSSTVLYINIVLFMIFPGTFYRNPWLNIYVFGANADSITNDVGMILVCGILKKLSFESPVSIISKRARTASFNPDPRKRKSRPSQASKISPKDIDGSIAIPVEE